jgi:hypothetical protein
MKKIIVHIINKPSEQAIKNTAIEILNQTKKHIQSK